MLYGLYQSALGAQAQSYRIDVVANNLANAGTSGFKRDLALFQSNRPYDVENGVGSDPPGNQNALSGGVTPMKPAIDFSDGSLIHTGASYDVALTGHGFFQVGDGSQKYLTRNGRLSVNQNGELVTAGSGMHVLNTIGAPIAIPPEAVEVGIASDGMITAMRPDGEQAQLGRLALVQTPAEQQLQKIGNSLFAAPRELTPARSDLQVKQGFVEASDVSPVSETVEMIQASRAFETNINMIKFQDDALDRLLQSTGAH